MPKFFQILQYFSVTARLTVDIAGISLFYLMLEEHLSRVDCNLIYFIWNFMRSVWFIAFLEIS